MAQAKFQPLPAKETQIITPIFRLSYPHIWEKHHNLLAKRDQFDIVMMFDKKTAVAELKDMMTLASKVAQHRFGMGCKGIKTPFKDGDTAKTQTGELISEKNPVYKGHMILSSWTKNQPGVVDSKNAIILNHDEVYGGCYCRAQVNCYAYEMGGNRGISFGLLHIQKVKDGDPFGARTRPEDAFASIEGGEVSLADPAGMQQEESMFS